MSERGCDTLIHWYIGCMECSLWFPAWLPRTSILLQTDVVRNAAVCDIVKQDLTCPFSVGEAFLSFQSNTTKKAWIRPVSLLRSTKTKKTCLSMKVSAVAVYYMNRIQMMVSAWQVQGAGSYQPLLLPPKSDSNSKMPHLWNLPKKRLIMPGSTIRSVQVDLFWGTRLTCYLFRH